MPPAAVGDKCTDALLKCRWISLNKLTNGSSENWKRTSFGLSSCRRVEDLIITRDYAAVATHINLISDVGYTGLMD